MLVARYGATLMLLLSLAGQIVDAGTALGRDERRAERISGDDDPILIPRSTVPRFSDSGFLDSTATDPVITGSVKKPLRRPRRRCSLLGWFPDQEPDQEFREVC